MENESQSGVNFLGLLALLFIALKLTGHIHWPWLWVLSPIWIPTAFVLVVASIALAVDYYNNYRAKS
jgi:hypothetical protein